MPKPIEYVAQTHKYLKSLEKGELEETLNTALETANKQLSDQGIRVIFDKDLGSNNMHLKIQHDQEVEHIDMIGMAALDEASIKSADALAEEIVLKTNQHLAARKTDGILFSSLGSKFDTRALKHHKVSIDPNGYLRFNGHRVALKVGDQYWPLQASTFRSSSIIRLINEGDEIRSFDDLDLVRIDKRGMLINVSKIHDIAIDQLVPRAREAAKEYSGKYYLVERDELTPERIKHLSFVLSEIPSP